MKLNKILSIFTSVLVGGALLCGTVNAEETLTEPKTEYTLEELFEMSDEEFLQLENAEGYYNRVRSDVVGFDRYEPAGISGVVREWLEKEDLGVKYTANITESQIKRLLGDTVEYKIKSPISVDVEYLMSIGKFAFQNTFLVRFPTLEKSVDSDNIEDEDIMKMAKCWYCVNQVIPVEYDFTISIPWGGSSEDMIIGDVNFDLEVNTLDLIYMAKFNLNFFIPTEAQITMGDLNKDGNLDCLDIEMLIENLLGNFELI